MQQQRSATTDIEYLYGRALYPATPLSWLAPLWALLCGAIASGSCSWAPLSALRWMTGLLLVGPLLGIAWGVGTHVAWPSPHDVPLGEFVRPVRRLPYTAPGSPSSRLSRWLALASSRWETARPVLARPLLQLAVSTLGALVVSAQLGLQPFLLSLGQLALAYVDALARRRWTRHLLLAVSFPLLLSWLLGYSLYHTLTWLSVVAGAAFALTFYAHARLEEGSGGLAWLFLAQLVTFGVLVLIKQPIVAAIIALSATSQLILLPLLEGDVTRPSYFRAVQVHLIANMILTALALGY